MIIPHRPSFFAVIALAGVCFYYAGVAEASRLKDSLDIRIFSAINYVDLLLDRHNKAPASLPDTSDTATTDLPMSSSETVASLNKIEVTPPAASDSTAPAASEGQLIGATTKSEPRAEALSEMKTSADQSGELLDKAYASQETASGRRFKVIASVFTNPGDPHESFYTGKRIDPSECGCALPHELPHEKGQYPNTRLKLWIDGRETTCTVVEVGPWTQIDGYWWNKEAKPAAEFYQSMGEKLPYRTSGRWSDSKNRVIYNTSERIPKNGAGIDLTPGCVTQKQMDQGTFEVEWAFLGEAPPKPASIADNTPKLKTNTENMI